jgi:hypothetical protein
MSIKIKNVDKLQQGQVFKNFKELCLFLEEPVRDGPAKAAFLKQLEAHAIISKPKGSKSITISEIRAMSIKPFKPYKKDSLWVRQAVHELIVAEVIKLDQSTLIGSVYLSNKALRELVKIVHDDYYKDRQDYLAVKHSNLEATSIYYQDMSQVIAEGMRTCMEGGLDERYHLPMSKTYRLRYSDRSIGYAEGIVMQHIIEARLKLEAEHVTAYTSSSYKEFLRKVTEKVDEMLDAVDIYANTERFTIIDSGYLFYPTTYTIERLKEKGLSAASKKSASLEMSASVRKVMTSRLEKRLTKSTTGQAKVLVDHIIRPQQQREIYAELAAKHTYPEREA